MHWNNNGLVFLQWVGDTQVLFFLTVRMDGDIVHTAILEDLLFWRFGALAVYTGVSYYIA